MILVIFLDKEISQNEMRSSVLLLMKSLNRYGQAPTQGHGRQASVKAWFHSLGNSN